MTKCKIIGMRDVSFTDNATNKPINGVTLYYIYPDQNVNGAACGKCFVSDSKFRANPVKLNEEYVILFNQRGKVDGFLAAKNLG